MPLFRSFNDGLKPHIESVIYNATSPFVIAYDKTSIDALMAAEVIHESKMFSTKEKCMLPASYHYLDVAGVDKNVILLGRLLSIQALKKLCRKVDNVIVFDPTFTGLEEISMFDHLSFPKNLTIVSCKEHMHSKVSNQKPSSICKHIAKTFIQDASEGVKTLLTDIDNLTILDERVETPYFRIMALRTCMHGMVRSALHAAKHNEYGEWVSKALPLNDHYMAEAQRMAEEVTSVRVENETALSAPVMQGYGFTVASHLARTSEAGIGFAWHQQSGRKTYYVVTRDDAPISAIDIAKKNGGYGDGDYAQFHFSNDAIDRIIL